MSLSSVAYDPRVAYPQPSPYILSPEVQKYIEQAEHKRQYNKDYYRSRVKPKKEEQKRELELLRERCAQLESRIHAPAELIEARQEIVTLTERNSELLEKLHQYEKELLAVKQALEVTRQRNYELMSLKSDQLLPSLGGWTLSSDRT